MATDFEDWTNGISVVSGPLASDLPDWTEAIAAGSGAAFYASLTGVGESTTPGALTQAGGLTVNAGSDAVTVTSGSTTPLTIDSTGTGGVIVESTNTNGGLVIESKQTINITQTGLALTTGIELDTSGNIGQILINSGTGGISLQAASGTITLQSNTFRVSGSTLGFFGHTLGGQPTITGSKGGNVALANLLTALAGLGLVVDSTT